MSSRPVSSHEALHAGIAMPPQPRQERTGRPPLHLRLRSRAARPAWDSILRPWQFVVPVAAREPMAIPGPSRGRRRAAPQIVPRHRVNAPRPRNPTTAASDTKEKKFGRGIKRRMRRSDQYRHRNSGIGGNPRSTAPPRIHNQLPWRKKDEVQFANAQSRHRSVHTRRFFDRLYANATRSTHAIRCTFEIRSVCGTRSELRQDRYAQSLWSLHAAIQ